MKSKRDIFLALTILAFFVTAPVVTLYTAGYRYQWKKQRFERVGFFETSTVPNGAQVILDGTRVGKTPYVDMGILPGRYSLRLERDGFRSFSTDFDVRSGLSTLLLDTVLWKDTVPVLKAVAPQGAVLDAKGTHVAWIETGADGLNAMMSVVTGENRRVGCVLPTGTDTQVSWNQSGEAALYTVATPGGVQGCIIGQNGNAYVLSNVMGKDAQRVLKVEWSPFDDTHLLVRGKENDTVVAYERDENKIVFPQSVPFTIRGSKLYGVRNTASGAELFSHALTSLSLSFGNDSAGLPAGEYTFLPSPAKYIVVREARHGRIDVFSTSGLERLATVIAERLVFETSRSGERFLAVNGYEISMYDLDTETSRLVTRYSQPITDAVWHPLGKHALIVVDGRVIALPFERSAEEAVVLGSFEQAAELRTDAKGTTLTLLGTRDGKAGVWTIELQ